MSIIWKNKQYYTVLKIKKKTTISHHMDEFLKSNTDWKKPVTKYYVLYNSIYINVKSRPTSTMLFRDTWVEGKVNHDYFCLGEGAWVWCLWNSQCSFSTWSLLSWMLALWSFIKEYLGFRHISMFKKIF